MNAEPNQSAARFPDETQPTADRAVAPIWLITLLAVLTYVGLVSLDKRGGGFNVNVYPPYANIEQVVGAWPVDPAEKQKHDGKIVFHNNCEVCHQATGLGSPANGCPPLAGSDWVNAAGPNRVVRIVLNGLTGPISVSGNSYGLNANVMTPFGPGLSDQQIADVLTYVRSEWNNKAAAVTAEQVKAIRAKTASKNGNWSPADLLQIPDKD
jgi:mono/diheme cytochrome c family protein